MKRATIKSLESIMYGLVFAAVVIVGCSEEPFKMTDITIPSYLMNLLIVIGPLLLAAGIIKFILYLDAEHKRRIKMQAVLDEISKRREAEERARVFKEMMRISTLIAQADTEPTASVTLQIPDFMRSN